MLCAAVNQFFYFLFALRETLLLNLTDCRAGGLAHTPLTMARYQVAGFVLVTAGRTITKMTTTVTVEATLYLIIII